MTRPERYRTWPVLAIGFGLLFLLMAVLSASFLRGAARARSEVDAVLARSYRNARALAEVQAGVYRSAVLIRDHLIAPEALSPPLVRAELARLRSEIDEELAGLQGLESGEGARRKAELLRELREYWLSLLPLLEAGTRHRREAGATFLREEVVPRRRAVLVLTARIQDLSEESVRREESRIEASRGAQVSSVRSTLLAVSLIGFAIAAFSVARTAHLERRSRLEHDRAEGAEEELRRLSQKLLQAQEQERKSLSRELHDEIGQQLTALRLNIGRLERMRSSAEDEFRAEAAEAKAVTEGVSRSVRDLAMGLRPSMLDDLGLGPALEWQTREFSRHAGLPATVEVVGSLETLPEPVRTCAYRITQEALTNCARHAQATSVAITLRAGPDRLWLRVQDDGVGLGPDRGPRRGLGLVGIEERVRELGGSVAFRSSPGEGTRVEAELPLRAEACP